MNIGWSRRNLKFVHTFWNGKIKGEPERYTDLTDIPGIISGWNKGAYNDSNHEEYHE